MSMQRNQGSSFLYGGNAPYMEEQYEQYLADPTQVPQEWKDWFDALRATPATDGTNAQDVPHAPVVERFAALARQPVAARASGPDIMKFARKQVAVQSLVAAYRMVGTRQANLDPLRWVPSARLPELAPAYYGLDDADMGTRFSAADSYFSDEETDLRALVSALEQTYCGTLGAETMHLGDARQRQWWQMRLESTRSRTSLPAHRKLRILDRLTAAEGLEKFLHSRFVGQTRFSLEGGESLIVLLDELVRGGAALGIRHAVMGMAHRGRLNVLVNVAGKPASELFDDFQAGADADLLAGDVKYHKGHTAVVATDDGPVEVMLAFNPSHLEIVNPVVQGIARAKADARRLTRSAVLPIEIHGDAAVVGQGIVQETLNLSSTRGHGTGGTVHVVVNNQVGFTTSDPRDARSTFYSSDVAKMIEAPVLHVNGDDPEAVAFAAQLALDFRAEFARSVVIEIVCFRRHGHQEQDTPTMTQPLMYRAIAAHPGVRALYARRLAAEHVVTDAQADAMVQGLRERLAAVYEASVRRTVARPATPSLPLETGASRVGAVAPTLEQVRTLAERITQLPAGHALHPLVKKLLDARREMAAGTRPLDWGMGEHLAFATLLAGGTDVRLSGQDSERGTFGHRHAVLYDQDRVVRGEGTWVPLRHVGDEQGVFSVTNSTLSEAAVLAYEYGYSATRPDALVLWEAQYGDFANGAQVVVDQFISAGFAKWGQRSGVVMLLPHGQDGAGPEHASARLERYLQLCAQDNMRVCQPTTPAQMFHLLRSQAAMAEARPLVVMTPKSLLRHPAAVSSLAELSGGAFQAVIGDAELAAADDVERVILCSGKVYYELMEQRRRSGRQDVAIVRVEQLYPFPEAALATELSLYRNARVVVWAQEEAKNQGAWQHLEPGLRVLAHPAALQYAGPAAAASTAPGSPAGHAAWQAEVLRAAFED